MDSSNWAEIKQTFSTAFDLPEHERASFLSGCGDSVRVEVEKLLKADEKAKSFILEPAIFEAGIATDEDRDTIVDGRIDGYEIIREIGQGGMGTVYLARRADGSFDKTVAIKLVKRGMDTNAVLKRFLVERSILAQLEHPNIAGLIDGGTTENGLPYFVMEYVDGLPITKYCDANDLSIRERLKLFQKVCAAISYAHANLVVHRDVKPSNILVTRDGTPKLLDFGIAKLLHPDPSETAEATATMFRILTPEYASPEQIGGQPITTAADVYSLGVVLYELLCGTRPYKIKSRLSDEAAREILTAEPVKPSSVVSARISHSVSPADPKTNDGRHSTNEGLVSNIQTPRSLRGDLDNIVLKAIRKEPERRYASVQEFSEDIRRHLAGLPVTATADTKIYRFKKFVRRHSAGVAAGGLIALTLIAATTITGWQAIAARRERDKAEQRFNEVRQLTRTITFEYYDEIIKLPGSTPLLEKMVKDTATYLDNLAAESSDPELLSEIATTYQKIGDVQGNPYQGNLGNTDGAIENYKKSLAIREKLATGNPSNTQMQRDLAKSYESSGDMLWVIGSYRDAHQNYEKSLNIHSRLAEADPGNADEMYETGRARHRIGQALSRQGNYDGAWESFDLGLQKFQEVVSLAPTVGKYRRGLGSAYCKLGDVAFARKDWQSALENHRQAHEIWSALAAAEPQKAHLKRDTALTSDRISVDLEKLAEFKQALTHSIRTVELQEQIVAADPKNYQYAAELGIYYVHLGSIQQKLKNSSVAPQNVTKGLATMTRHAEINPKDMDLKRDLALAYQIAGEVFLTNGESDRALEYFRLSSDLIETTPLRQELGEKLAENYRMISEILKKTGRSKEALELEQKIPAAFR